MTDKQSNYLDMYGVVLTLYTANQAVIDTVAARATAFGALQTNVTAINTNIANQSLVVTGVSADKAQARATLNGLSQVIFGLARTWALAVGDLTNAGEFDFSLSEIAKVKDDSITPFVEHRLAIVNSNLPALADYGITAALVTQWENAITDYGSVVSLPRTAIVSRSTSTTQLRQLFNDTQRLLRETIDPLMLPFKVSDPELYTKYRKARIIIDRRGIGDIPPEPGQTMKLTGTVTHAVTAAPLPNVEVTIFRSSGNITVLTNASGNYTTNNIQLTSTESVQVRFRLTGMEDRTETTNLVPGQDKVLNAVMKPSTVIFGRVTDNFGNSVQGATVRLSNADMIMEVQTDINGNYRLPLSGLEQPLTATLTAEAMGMMPSSRPVTIAPDEQQEQNFTLSPMAPPPPMP